MKSLKFSDPLPELILSGVKNTTWRINDDKKLSVGDTVSLKNTSSNEFAKVKIISVKETTFKNLTKEDRGRT
jgi:hypothetical protein